LILSAFDVRGEKLRTSSVFVTSLSLRLSASSSLVVLRPLLPSLSITRASPSILTVRSSSTRNGNVLSSTRFLARYIVCRGPTQRKSEEVPVSAQTSDESFPIVGIGASAGGLEAFTQLLRELPSDVNMALVLVQHLDPTYKSMLTELLSRTTSLTVLEVTDGVRVKPRHVYVIPPNTAMTISERVLHLTARVEVEGKHMPIDHFLLSLAKDQKSRAIGVILSGTSMDGIQGLRAIKDEGGITIAQDEKSAKYYDLPRSAVAAGCVDLVLRPEDIAQELVKLSRHPYVPYLETEGAENLLPQSDLEKIFGLLRKATKVDFADYKHATIKRRILRRMLFLKTEKMEDYLKYLQTNPGELGSLFQDILISVTGFFREPETFEALKHEIFPSILKNRSADDAIRVWVPGCSTGEEVYSLAISLVEYLDRSRVHPSIQIFATDVNEAVLEKAR